MLQTHLPGYLEKAAALNSAGAAVIACISVNDAFVMSEWGKANNADGKVRMLADTNAAFTKVSSAPQETYATLSQISTCECRMSAFRVYIHEVLKL